MVCWRKSTLLVHIKDYYCFSLVFHCETIAVTGVKTWQSIVASPAEFLDYRHNLRNINHRLAVQLATAIAIDL